MKINLILFCLILVSQSCALEGSLEKREVKFMNKSNGIVYGFRSQTDSFFNFYSKLDETAMEELYKTSKDSVILSIDKPNNWDSYIRDSQESKMRFFVISKDSVDKYGWENIINQNIYTKVYKVNIEDLNKLKWTIIYDEQ